MIGLSSGAQRATSRQDLFRVAANLPNKDEYGTLILDRAGRIISCGTPAAHIFGAPRDRMVGRCISDFVVGLFPASNSPSYRARHLVHLCNHGDWRTFAAMEGNGQRFMVELNIARMVTDGQEIFVLNVRRSDEHKSSRGSDRVQAPVHSIG